SRILHAYFTPSRRRRSDSGSGGERRSLAMCTYGYRAPVEDIPPLPEHAALARYRVLLIEDDPEYGRMVERVLRRSRPPLWVHREERLDAGLDRLEHDHYDALVMDLKLPDAAGRSTLENACAQADHLPVVVLTSTDD